MKKINLIVIGILILVGGALFFLNSGDRELKKDQIVLEKTLNISKDYVALRYRTDNILINAKEYSYKDWKDEVDVIIEKWEDLEKESVILSSLATEMEEQKTSLQLMNTATAYDKQEISNIFDRAPAGKKIATLAKHLGVDAKKAYAILTQDQAQVQADAWNEAGDTFKKLEASAVAIKDVCKVATFVGTIAMTGGTSAIVAGSTIGKVAVVVAGADLTLEVTDDAAKIALGDKNKISTIVGSAREVTEPAAAILMISTLPKNLTKGIDKLGAVTFGADQLNSTIQDGKVIGIKLPEATKEENKKIEVVVLEEEEVEEWINNEANSTEKQTVKEIEEVMGINQEKELEKDNEENGEKNLEVSTGENGEKVVGMWKGILNFTSSQEADEQAMDFALEIKKDGIIGGEAGEVYDSWVLVEGNLLRLILATDEGEGYDEFRLDGNSLTYVKRAGINSEGVWQEDHAGSDFFGGKFMQIHLKKQ